jgi:hypothetical protein
MMSCLAFLKLMLFFSSKGTHMECKVNTITMFLNVVIRGQR